MFSFPLPVNFPPNLLSSLCSLLKKGRAEVYKVLRFEWDLWSLPRPLNTTFMVALPPSGLVWQLTISQLNRGPDLLCLLFKSQVDLGGLGSECDRVHDVKFQNN